MRGRRSHRALDRKEHEISTLRDRARRDRDIPAGLSESHLTVFGGNRVAHHSVPRGSVHAGTGQHVLLRCYTSLRGAKQKHRKRLFSIARRGGRAVECGGLENR
jgi:hypothetical protein